MGFIKWIFYYIWTFVLSGLISYHLFSSNYMDKYFPHIHNKIINTNVYFKDVSLKPSMDTMEYIDNENNIVIQKQSNDVKDLVDNLSF